MKAELGDGEEEFDLEEGYSSQQQGPPLYQPSQSQEAEPSQEVPDSGTTSGSSKASGCQTSPHLAGKLQQKQKDDEEEEKEEEDEEDKGPVIAVPEAISTTASTTLTMPGLKCLYNRSQVEQQQQRQQQQVRSNTDQHSPSNGHVTCSAARGGKSTGAD